MVGNSCPAICELNRVTMALPIGSITVEGACDEHNHEPTVIGMDLPIESTTVEVIPGAVIAIALTTVGSVAI